MAEQIQSEVLNKEMSLSERQAKIELCANILRKKKFNERYTYNMASHLLSDIKLSSEADEFIKKLQESNAIAESYIGETDKSGKGKDSHYHSFVVMVLNWGESLVGITISTEGDDNHVHTIRIMLDQKIVSIVGYTNFGSIVPIENQDKEIPIDNYHNHKFEVDVESVKDEVGSTYVPSQIYSEKKIDVESMLSEIKNQRQAEIALLMLAQTDNEKITDAIKEKIFIELHKKYPKSLIFDDSCVAEMEIALAKINPKAKVRNRGSVACPAGSSNVTDNKDHFPANCLKGDTKIALLDGTEKTIAELVGKEVWIYAYDINKKSIVPAFAKNIRKTGINVEVIKVTLDNGKEIICTAYHPFMIRNGEYKLAGNLQIGESLMPIHLSIWGQPENYPKFIKSGYHSFYNQVYQPYYKRWETVHEMVVREFNKLDDNPTYVVHHNDKNKLNNSPDNLIIMNKREHSRLHGLEKLNDPEFRKQAFINRKTGIRKRWNNPEQRDRQSLFMKQENKRRSKDPIYLKKLSENVSIGRKKMFLLRNNMTIAQEIEMYENALKNSGGSIIDAAKFLEVHPNTLRRRLRNYSIIPNAISRDELSIIESKDQIKFNERKEYFNKIMSEYLTVKDAAKFLGIHTGTLHKKLRLYGITENFPKYIGEGKLIDNHKVISIEKCGFADVYDIEVPEYHNFGLTCGIFVHNSQAQARNALARVAQYKTAPSWWKGSLESLQKKVRSFVKNKYPAIKVTGLSEHYALRFKDSNGVYFHTLFTSNINTAKHDAGLYLKEIKNTTISLIKFSSNEDGNSFEDMGEVRFYDIKNQKDWEATTPEIMLSEKDPNGMVKIEILREGVFNHEEYGKFSITKEKMSEIVKNFNDNVLDREISFDFNHMPELPAAAWVRKLSISQRPLKGTNRFVLNAHAQLTPRGEQAIKDGDFKYFSSEYTDNFVDKENGKQYGTTLKGGGLTNRPWMPGMAPIQLSEISENIYLVTKNYKF